MSRRRSTVPSWIAAAIVCIAGCRARTAMPDAEVVAENNRGVGLMGQFDFAHARDAFAAVAAARPDRRDLQVNLAVATLNRQQEGDDAEAQRELAGIVAADPANVRAHYVLGLALLNDGRASDALPHFTAVADRRPADAYAAYYLGQCKAQLGDTAGALASYERALTLNPRLRSAAYGAFQAMQRLGRADAAQMLDRFRTLEGDPRSEVVEFKYTRMGPLGEVAAIDVPSAAAPARPSGALFEKTPLKIAGAADVTWRRFTAAHPASITAADIDGDGMIDLFIAAAIEQRGAVRNAVLLNRGDSGFELALTHPLASVSGVDAVLWGDYDNDGFTDAYLCRQGSNQLWRQTARGQWNDVTASARAEGGGGTTIDGALFDADHDGDLDILLVKSSGANELLNNDGNGTFRSLGQTIGLSVDSRPSSGLVVADLDSDRDADILVIKAAPPNEILINDRTWQYRRDNGFAQIANTPIAAAVAGDLDAAAHPVIFASTPTGISRWTRSPGGTWDAAEVRGTAALARSARLALVDIDGDGRLDLIATGSDGRWSAFALGEGGDAGPLFAADSGAAGWAIAVLDQARGPSIVSMPVEGDGAPIMWKPGPGRFPFATVTLSGRDPNSSQRRSNLSGIGAQIAARVDSRWTVPNVYRQQSGPGQSLQPVALGTGGAPRIDFVSIVWSDGVLQTELSLAPGARRIEETERQLSSCPVLFAFDGRRFAFVTDILGVGGMGTPSSPGVYNTPRPRESVLLPDGALAAKDGRFELKITEPMEEVAYIDAARLVAYDVPPGWNVVPDERMATAPPEATGEARFYRDERVPRRAIDNRGRDVTKTIATVDGVAAPTGDVDPRYIGLTAESTLTLEFDGALDAPPGDPMLIADGWIEYPYAQTLFAAWQAHAAYQPPTIEARDADGRWHVLLREFGYPAGMPRRMSLPLGRLPKGTTALRLQTTQEIYWDRLAVAYAAAAPNVRTTVLPLRTASLATTGFAHREVHDQRRPSYDYDRRTPLWDTRHQRGNYTALGTMTELVAHDDGAVAIIGPGEEVDLVFDAGLPPLAGGWTRRFVLDARGWCKDMDLYTRDGDTVEPVPGTRGTAAAALQRKYTTRYESGR